VNAEYFADFLYCQDFTIARYAAALAGVHDRSFSLNSDDHTSCERNSHAGKNLLHLL
jgi:hypothetical protein